MKNNRFFFVQDEIQASIDILNRHGYKRLPNKREKPFIIVDTKMRTYWKVNEADMHISRMISQCEENQPIENLSLAI